MDGFNHKLKKIKEKIRYINIDTYDILVSKREKRASIFT